VRALGFGDPEMTQPPPVSPSPIAQGALEPPPASAQGFAPGSRLPCSGSAAGKKRGKAECSWAQRVPLSGGLAEWAGEKVKVKVGSLRVDRQHSEDLRPWGVFSSTQLTLSPGSCCVSELSVVTIMPRNKCPQYLKDTHNQHLFSS
jgi:hypothetical protein